MRAAQSCPGDWRAAITSEAVCAALLFLLILTHCAKDPDVQGGSRVKWHCLEAEWKVTLFIRQELSELTLNVTKWHF